MTYGQSSVRILYLSAHKLPKFAYICADSPFVLFSEPALPMVIITLLSGLSE